jgi:predicted GNAT family N-acyltransferase
LSPASSPAVTVRPTHDPDEIAAALELRVQVFCEEQGVDGDEELDGLDQKSTQIVALDDGAVVATCRLQLVEGDAKVERMAVARSLRGTGVGRELLARAEEEAHASGAPRMILHAQRAAEPFYARCGYRAEGDTFLEAEIEHVRMTKPLVGGEAE